MNFITVVSFFGTDYPFTYIFFNSICSFLLNRKDFSSKCPNDNIESNPMSFFHGKQIIRNSFSSRNIGGVLNQSINKVKQKYSLGASNAVKS